MSATSPVSSSAASASSVTSPVDAPQALRVQAVFHDLDPRKAEHIAAEMVARAHELANAPACECDVDVNVESLAPPAVPPTPGSAESPAHTDRPSAGATGATPASAR